MIKIPNPFDLQNYRTEKPSDDSSLMVRMAETVIKPKIKMTNKFDLSYAFSLGAFMTGHPQGATNIGMFVLYELYSDEIHQKLVGEHNKKDVAEAWFLKAIKSPFHSPQAEIEMAKICAMRPMTSETKGLVNKYLKLAEKRLENPDSLWSDRAKVLRKELNSTSFIISSYFERKASKPIYKDMDFLTFDSPVHKITYLNLSPPTDGRKFLYKGSRYFAFEMSEEYSYDGWEKNHSIAVWDTRIGIIGFGEETAEGAYKGQLAFSHVQIRIPECKTIREFVEDVVAYDRGYVRDCS
jgi:hypothetical protein